MEGHPGEEGLRLPVEAMQLLFVHPGRAEPMPCHRCCMPCPWQVGAMLGGVARVHHHDGFKAAWEECDRLTVLKHLDNDAPSLHVRRRSSSGRAPTEPARAWASSS